MIDSRDCGFPLGEPSETTCSVYVLRSFTASSPVSAENETTSNTDSAARNASPPPYSLMPSDAAVSGFMCAAPNCTDRSNTAGFSRIQCTRGSGGRLPCPTLLVDCARTDSETRPSAQAQPMASSNALQRRVD